jgi:hypothetical protein
MVDEFFHKNLEEAAKDIFLRLEDKKSYASYNMALLMEALEKRFGPFREVGGSKSKVRFVEKSGDSEDQKNESRKENEKEKPSSSAITPSKPLFKT